MTEDKVLDQSMTAGVKAFLNSDVLFKPEPLMVTGDTRSVIECAQEQGLSFQQYVIQNPELALRQAESSLSEWLKIQSAAAVEGAVQTRDGTYMINKNTVRLIDSRVQEASRQLDRVNEYIYTAETDGEKRKEHLTRVLYNRAVYQKDTKALVYLIDRVDGRPGETKVADLDYDNAYNVYQIIHTLFDKQLEVLNSGIGTKLCCCSRRAGKCWDPNTLLRKYDGTLIKAGEVRVGDLMMGADGKAQTVLATTTGKDRMYRIFGRKEGWSIDFTVNSVHVLTVRMQKDLSNSRGQYKHVYKKGGIYDIPLNEFIQLPDYVRDGFRLWRQQTDYPVKRHLIDPYMLGLWLGDGSKSALYIAVGEDEPEIRDRVLQYAQNNKFEVYERHQNHGSGHCNEIRIHNGMHGGAPSILLDELRRLNVYENKHIPQEYLIDSIENRLQLLAGLIDSDGNYFDGRLSFSNTDFNIIKGVFELCCSLGFKVTYNNQVKYYWSEAHDCVQDVTVYTIHIKGNLSLIPTVCPRKQATDSKQNADYGFWVEVAAEDGDYAGFTLDGDGRLLLDDYTVTHNTHTACAAVLIEALRRPNTVCVYIGPTMENTEQIVDTTMNKVINTCQLRDRRGQRLNWRRLDNGSKLIVTGLSNNKDPDKIRGYGAKVIVMDEFFHVSGDLLSYMHREVLKPMQLDYADDYKFICIGTPPKVKGTFGEHAWKTWDVPHFFWTWEDNPHPVDIEARRALIEQSLKEEGYDWNSTFARREYSGEWIYDDDLLLYPEYHCYDPRETVPPLHVDMVLFGIDYGVSDNDTLIGIAWDASARAGYVFHEDKFNRLDIKDRTISQLQYLKQQVEYAWEEALGYFPSMDAREANKRILWDADDNDQHVTDELNMNVRLTAHPELRLNIENAHKTDKVAMYDKIRDLLRTANLLLIIDGKTARECEMTVLKRGPNGQVYPEIDNKTFHPDLLPAMRYALWNVIGNEKVSK